MREKPKPTSGDTTHTVIKVGLSTIPLLGGPAAEIFAAVVTPPLTKRRDEWVESIANELKKLEEKVDGFKIENLAKNEVFITTVMQATQSAIRNHQQEKLEALRNAVINTALSTIDENINMIFLNFIDTLTPWHLKILKLFNDPVEWGKQNGITWPNWSAGGASMLLEHALPELKGRREFYDQIARDLYIRGLWNSESLHGMTTSHGLFGSRSTAMGKNFIRFITAQ